MIILVSEAAGDHMRCLAKAKSTSSNQANMQLCSFSPMSIECHVDANPRADIEWFFNGRPLPSFAETEYTPEGACRLKIARFTAEHRGAFKCTAHNVHGSADTIANLNVESEKLEDAPGEGAEAPHFSPGLADVSLDAGQPLELMCRVHGTKPHVIWHRDGVPLLPNDRIRVSFDPESGECKLRIEATESADQGTYRVVATNQVRKYDYESTTNFSFFFLQLGSANSACVATIRAKKEEAKPSGAEPRFTKGLVDQWLERGDTLVAHCIVESESPYEVKFYRNGQLLRPSNRVTIEITPDGSCRLTINDATMSDEGTYRAAVVNQFGSAQTQGFAHVDMTPSKAESVKLDEGEAPRFVVELEDTTRRPHDTIELEARVVGKPMPTCKWTLNGNPLRDDPRYEFTSDAAAGTYKLRIRDATRHDEGTWRLTANNASGTASSKSAVTVDSGRAEAAPSGRAPRISAHLADVRTTEGKPLRLECRVDAEPLAELTWQKGWATAG